MKSNFKETEKGFLVRLTSVLLVWAIVLTGLILPIVKTQAATTTNANSLTNLYRRPAPNFDLNLSRNLQNLRTATSAQTAALNTLKTQTNASGMTVRWNSFGGSPDVVYDFASAPFQGTPEEAGRAFLSQNAALFGISDINNLRVWNQTDALGGHLIRFQQTFNGIPVKDGGIGLVMNANNQVVMASGPFFPRCFGQYESDFERRTSKSGGEQRFESFQRQSAGLYYQSPADGLSKSDAASGGGR
jgi:hypothetical protein